MTSLHIGNNNIPVENTNEIIAIVEAKPAMKVFCAVPFRDKTITKLDVSGQSLGVEGALVIRRYLENNGALTSLDIRNASLNAWSQRGMDSIGPAVAASKVTNLNIAGNNLNQNGGVDAVVALLANGTLTSLDISYNSIGELAVPTVRPAGWEEAKNQGDGKRIFRVAGGGAWAFGIPLGVFALADAIKNNGAITSLNVSDNDLGRCKTAITALTAAIRACKYVPEAC
jgi:hypothetical protein